MAIVANLGRSAEPIDRSFYPPVKYAVIDDASSGDNEVVAAVPGKRIRVISAFLVAAGAVNVRFESGAAGTALTGQMNLTTNVGFSLNAAFDAKGRPKGHFQTAKGESLNLELSGAVSVDGSLTYVEIDE